MEHMVWIAAVSTTKVKITITVRPLRFVFVRIAVPFISHITFGHAQCVWGVCNLALANELILVGYRDLRIE